MKQSNDFPDKEKKCDESRAAEERVSLLLNRIRVSSEVAAMGEEMRNEVYEKINSKIKHTPGWSLRMRLVAAAIFIGSIFVLSNYISYRYGHRQQDSQLVELFSPSGLRSSVVLPDGTKVILNSGTTFSYPTSFVSENREVSLKGEAFFDVAHDAKHPFIVKTGEVDIRVLGTSFNVQAYQEDRNVAVTLESGKVEVRLADSQGDCIELLPNKQIRYDKSTRVFSEGSVATNLYTAWKDGKFYFDNMTFEGITKQLERHFNVKIEINSNNLKETTFTGEFIRGENLEQILRVITADTRIVYQIENERVILSN